MTINEKNLTSQQNVVWDFLRYKNKGGRSIL